MKYECVRVWFAFVCWIADITGLMFFRREPDQRCDRSHRTKRNDYQVPTYNKLIFGGFCDAHSSRRSCLIVRDLFYMHRYSLQFAESNVTKNHFSTHLQNANRITASTSIGIPAFIILCIQSGVQNVSMKSTCRVF